MKYYSFFYGILLSCFLPAAALACTNLLVTRSASADGSTMISYLADSHVLYGELYYWPAQDHAEGSMRDIYEWDTDKRLGKIKEAKHTYQVIGNMNEFQLVIGETTFGGRKEITQDTNAIMDYGSLIYVTLQRTRTAREAIAMMAELVAEYGYYSSGESFSIADPDEVWLMEMIGKGPGNKGAVWVALKVPDGYISAHANQSRIGKFPLKDKANCLYSKDVITYARSRGFFKGKDEDFSFADAYAPMDFHAQRFCEARVWSIFRRAAPSLNLTPELVDGSNLSARLPLWIKPDKPISMKDAFSLMRDHFEGTPFDMTKDPGAEPFGLPYRWRPLSWKIDSTSCFNERAISTQQTGFSFVSQSRRQLPDAIGGVLWFGVDDNYSTVYSPFYCCSREVSRNYAQGNGDLYHYSPDAAFWVFNKVSNFAYLRYNYMITDIQKAQQSLEDSALMRQPSIEAEAMKLYKTDPNKAIESLTRYSVSAADAVVKRWQLLFEELMVKYIDGNIKSAPGKLEQPGYSEYWYRSIIEETGNKFKAPY